MTVPGKDRITVRLFGGDGNPTLRFEYASVHPVDSVWQAITDSARITAWFGFPVQLDPVKGGRFAITFSPDMIEEGTVREFEPRTLLEYTGRDDVYRWELAETEDGCRTTLINTVGDPEHIVFSAAGFHRALMVLDDLISTERGVPPTAGQPSFDQLVAHYTLTLKPV